METFLFAIKPQLFSMSYNHFPPVMSPVTLGCIISCPGLCIFHSVLCNANISHQSGVQPQVSSGQNGHLAGFGFGNDLGIGRVDIPLTLD